MLDKQKAFQTANIEYQQALFKKNAFIRFKHKDYLIESFHAIASSIKTLMEGVATDKYGSECNKHHSLKIICEENIKGVVVNEQDTVELVEILTNNSHLHQNRIDGYHSNNLSLERLNKLISFYNKLNYFCMDHVLRFDVEELELADSKLSSYEESLNKFLSKSLEEKATPKFNLSMQDFISAENHYISQLLSLECEEYNRENIYKNILKARKLELIDKEVFETFCVLNDYNSNQGIMFDDELLKKSITILNKLKENIIDLIINNTMD